MIGGRGVAGIGGSKGCGRDDLQTSTPCKRTSYKGVDLEFTNNYLVADFGGNSRSRSSFAMDPTV